MNDKLQSATSNTLHGFADATKVTQENLNIEYSLDNLVERDDSSWSTQSPCSNGMPTSLGSESQGVTIPDFMTYNPQFDFGLDHLQWIHEGADLEIRNILPDNIISQGFTLDNHAVNLLAGSLTAFGTSEANNALPTSGQALFGLDTVPGAIQTFTGLNIKDFEQVLQCENFCHIESISESTHSKVQQFFALHQTAGFPECPSIHMMHAFAELYFEFFDHNFPCIHKQQLHGGPTSWILLVAVASIGSQYSAIENASVHTKCLQHLLEKAIHDYMPTRCSDITIDFVQSVFISQINLCCEGKKSAHLKQECQRSLLSTLVKQVSDDAASRRKKYHMTQPSIEEEWAVWLSAETLTRLKYCVSRFECLQFALFHLKPQHFPGDYTRYKISAEALWSATTAEEWNSQRSPAMHNPLRSPFEEIVLTSASIVEERLENLQAAYRTALCARLQDCFLETMGRSSLSTFTTRNGFEDEKRSSYRSPLVDRLLEHILENNLASTYRPYFQSDCSLHVLSILRHVSLTAVYAFSGWEADRSETQEARTYLENWISNDMSSVRRCLWHAACVFRDLRNKSHFSCFDPFFILIATLVIWMYCTLSSGIVSYTDEPICIHREPARIDSFTDREALQHWLQHCSCRKIHLAGLGMLEGPEGAKRVIKEYRNILKSRVGWFDIRDALAFLAEQLLEDRLPRRRDSEE
ncbi:hypothetical protein COCC4DRAFT_60744 [Bipolaris maydis ATCC 48331]|uniref:Transcription factor domain-containing protein n=2 Tax=Cochliobolus heterostrophus TaxID=5016 RepID=M2UNA0_COCH5|nr:uncharacterized protein COCC4DRAFT_60744 [Bipolaris maydis ATCC 48331]EMD89377.1 hypothetical protein COCHEDRAFT_1216108 [Bipolaris maydis C5]KAJ5025011.1 hypothetical protein J3E73DRAFT_193373 [Bipolaris maydis]ENI04906.1 hypothetical protein COCC4DRAFT_60744 [Bipolaris maydis ATCC 48331]KAJ6212725.1 hypothetical protein PSV09DRAFT_1216108 [Bipolaris maydis]KAJ6265992.1 hypothetical protein PSV08DRAFT_189393 [Bipolaris maydis]